MSLKAERSHQLAIALVLCACYAANLWLTNVLRAQVDGVDTIWTANAFVIGALLLLPVRWAPACLAVSFTIQTIVILAFGHTAFEAVGFSLLNVVEAVVVVTLARRLNAVRLTTPDRFARLIFLALAPVLVVGTGILGVIVMLMYGEFPVVMVLNRMAAKFLGMSVVLPIILLLGHANSAPLARAKPGEALAGQVLVGGLAGLIFTPFGPVALLAMFPAITILGLRRGPRAVTIGMALICAVSLTLGAWQGAPSVLASAPDLNRQISLAQVYLAMVFATGLITALMATHQHRLRQLIVHRSTGDRRARDRAQAASEAKTEFLATMSHEIRTPLNSILGFAQVLERREDLSADGRHQVGLISRSGAALLAVVNDILDFSKVEAGRVELDPKPVDLTRVCRDALAIVAESAERKGLTVEMKVEGDLAGAHVCDDHRLCQVLLNFLNNAVKFTDAGGVTLTLSALAEGERDRVRIAIADTGPGIAAEALPVLFQRFYQVDGSVSRTHGGSGLGLAICKGLVEAMGGRVGVTSEPGVGSTFWLEAPMARAEAAPAKGLAADAQDPVTAHVLLVDDHPMNRELGAIILGLLGCSVDLASDGLEAVAAVQTRRYDVILMDVHMPGMDGLAATRAIRAMGGPVGETPIIAMSADVLPEQMSRMYAAGMVDSVPKPIAIANLHACLARWVGRTASGKAAAAA